MDKSTSVLGALDAQKLPSQAQIDAWTDCLVHQIDQVSAQELGRSQLSSHGKTLAVDVKRLLLAYKQLGDHKNGDDQLQDAIWNLTQGQMNVSAEEIKAMKDEAAIDAQKLSSAFKNMLLIFWGYFTSFHDGSELASFIRNVLADTAEVVESKAGSSKVQLRETDEQVQQGERDNFSRERTDDGTARDTKQQFEAGMDTAKTTGSQVIGAGQAAKQGVGDIGEKVIRNFVDVLDKVLHHAESDDAYRDSVTTVFNVASKWINRSVDAANKMSIDDVVNDPSGRIPAALFSLNTLLERLAGGKSTREVTDAFKTAAAHVREDPELRSYFGDLTEFVRRTLHEPTFARSEEYNQQRAHFRDCWQQLQSGESHKTWHDDLDRLRSRFKGYIQQIEQDPAVEDLRNAYVALGKDAADAALTLKDTAIGNANWIWPDMLDVVLPRVLEYIKNLPIPRTEYKDTDVEFVVENLNISSLRILPGRAHIRNTTDMNVSKEAQDKEASTSVRSKTQVRFQGVQLDAKDVSFWYHDNSMKPISEVSGLLGITIPERGVDVDIILSFIPQTDKRAKDPKQHAFLSVDRVKVSLNNPHFDIKKTNHPILFTAFKPIFRIHLERTLEASLEHQIKTVICGVDDVIFDLHNRAGVFRDTGMAPSAAYVSALWSELGHLKKVPGPFSGLQTTSVGVVRDDPRSDIKLAVGVQPQIISGDKHGPEVPAHEQQQRAARVAEQEKRGGEEATELGAPAVQESVISFAEEVGRKKKLEGRIEGWRSTAFEIGVHRASQY